MGSDTVDDGQSLLALTPAQSGHPSLTTPETRACATPLFKDFAMTWYAECEVAWRRTYRVTQLGAINQYLIPHFGEREVGQIKKADVLNFRATLAKVTARKTQSTLSNRRINAVMKPLRQILNEAADRFEFTSGFTNVKPLRLKRSDVQPFSIDDVEKILKTSRVDFRNYFTVRFFNHAQCPALCWHGPLGLHGTEW